jgi:hypothetical protein
MYLKDLELDLLWGRGLMNAAFWVILDKDPDICGFDGLAKMEFAPGSGRFCLQFIKISATCGGKDDSM